MRLVADIGGTNTRLALAQPGSGQIGVSHSYRNADFACFEDVAAAFLSKEKVQPEQMVVAMAGPVAGNTGRLTNLNWVIDGEALAARFDAVSVQVINDLTALGFAALNLTAPQLSRVVENTAQPAPHRQALVVGIGTGFNVSPVVATAHQTVCPAAELGHISLFASISSALDGLETGLSQAFPTIETLFSGRGRRKFLSLLTGGTVDSATPFIARQGAPDNERFDAVLDAYAELIGVLLAELKIAYLPSAGIFLAGGVARSSLTGSRADICGAAAMRENGFIPMSPPIWVIEDDAAALTGCAAIALDPL